MLVPLFIVPDDANKSVYDNDTETVPDLLDYMDNNSDSDSENSNSKDNPDGKFNTALKNIVALATMYDGKFKCPDCYTKSWGVLREKCKRCNETRVTHCNSEHSSPAQCITLQKAQKDLEIIISAAEAKIGGVEI